MLPSIHIFRNPHPGIAILLVFFTSLGTGIINFFRGVHLFDEDIDFWTAPICIGLASWLINVILVYRSRYLLSNYLLGWYWWCLLIALTDDPLTWKEGVLSVGISIWMAILFELGDERKKSLRTRSNLGFTAALLGLVQPLLLTLLIPSIISLAVGLKVIARDCLQVIIAWLMPIISYIAFLMLPFISLNPFIFNIQPNVSFRWPLFGEYIVLIWAFFALSQTLRALTNAKKPKRRGLLISWLGIGYAILLSFFSHNSSEYIPILAVFFGPHLVNLQNYIYPKKLQYWLTPSFLLAALVEIII